MNASGSALVRRRAAVSGSTTSAQRPSDTRRRAFVVLMWAAAVVAGAVLYQQVRQVELAPVVAAAEWGWVAVAAGFFAVSVAGATVNLLGCSPVRLAVLPTYAVQVAGGFVKLISPSAVGGAALNARYVQRAGASTSIAVASVGAAQVIQLMTTLALLAVLGPLTGTAVVPAVLRDGSGLVILAGAAVGASLVTIVALAALPRLRDRLVRMTASVIGQVRRPGGGAHSTARRVLLAVGGSVLLTLGLVLALTASVAAMGGSLAPVPIGVAFLLGSAVGSVIPTPGGIGTVEAALVAALVASGQAVAVALPAVLVFRAVTVWLPVPVGWVAFQLLRRRGQL